MSRLDVELKLTGVELRLSFGLKRLNRSCRVELKLKLSRLNGKCWACLELGLILVGLGCRAFNPDPNHNALPSSSPSGNLGRD